MNRSEKQFRRDRDRTANYIARKTGYASADDRAQKDWAFDAERYDHPKATNERGNGIRERRARAPPQFRKESTYVPRNQMPLPTNKYLATEASPPSDELLYTIPSLAEMTPTRNLNLLNTTAEGYLNIVEQCYTKMGEIDGRMKRSLPLAVFVHNYVQLYHLHMFKVAANTSQTAHWEGAEDINVESLERLLNADTVMIPVEIYDWLKGMTRFTDKTGYTYAPNVPSILVPKKRIRNVDGGHFGMPTAASHNSYEISIAPMVTKKTVVALFNNNIVNGLIPYTPLADNLIPENCTATGNLLGYRPNLRPLHRETLGMYAEAVGAWATTSVGSRIGYNSELWSKQNAVMMGFVDKMEIRTGMPPLTKGSLALYGTLVYDVEDQELAILRRENGRIESVSALDPSTIAAIAMKSYRRRRTYNAPGYCFVRPNDEAPPGWGDTINNSYEFEEPFAPNFGNADVLLNECRFTRTIAEGRYATILDQLKALTIKRK